MAPLKKDYAVDLAPATGLPIAEFARSTVADVDLAVAAAQAAFPAWAATSTTDRAVVLNAIADRLQAHLEQISVLESWENGKPVRETLGADIPLAIDHFRYFAAAIRTQQGSIKKLSAELVSYLFEPHRHRPGDHGLRDQEHHPLQHGTRWKIPERVSSTTSPATGMTSTSRPSRDSRCSP